jgi:hypothetical protein
VKGVKGNVRRGRVEDVGGKGQDEKGRVAKILHEGQTGDSRRERVRRKSTRVTTF